MTKLRDVDIRAELDTWIRELHRGDASTLVRHELGVCQGARRVDLAVVNSALLGFEIKSDRDTLLRLAGQATVYGAVFDELTLVTTERFVDDAAKVVPRWWGIMIAAPVIDGVSLCVHRMSLPNPVVEPMAVARLLWREEALDELQSRGCAVGLSAQPRWLLWERLVETTSLEELRSIVRERLKQRRWPVAGALSPGDVTFPIPAI